MIYISLGRIEEPLKKHNDKNKSFIDITLEINVHTYYIIVLKISCFIQEQISDLHTVFHHVSHPIREFSSRFRVNKWKKILGKLKRMDNVTEFLVTRDTLP